MITFVIPEIEFIHIGELLAMVAHLTIMGRGARATFHYLRNIFKVKLKLVFDWLGSSFFFFFCIHIENERLTQKIARAPSNLQDFKKSV